MNEYLSMIILGLVQGITEFLPVSSSGHLVLLEKMGVGEPGVGNNLILHCATLLVVLVAYRKRLLDLIKHPFCAQNSFIVTASVPTALFAAVIRFLLPDTTSFLPTFFLMTSFILLLPSLLPANIFRFDNKATVKALFVGTLQGVACLSGVSRSGTTATALLLAGCPREKVPEYSFLLSIPIIIGSSAVELLKSSPSTLSLAILPGFAVAFVSGSFSLKLFSRVLRKNDLPFFALYTLCMSVISFLTEVL